MRGAFERGAFERGAFFGAKVGAVYEALVKQGRPVWLSTEGSGVPWLHVRMDSRPKYYHTREFKDWKPWSEPTPL